MRALQHALHSQHEALRRVSTHLAALRPGSGAKCSRCCYRGFKCAALCTCATLCGNPVRVAKQAPQTRVLGRVAPAAQPQLDRRGNVPLHRRTATAENKVKYRYNTYRYCATIPSNRDHPVQFRGRKSGRRTGNSPPGCCENELTILNSIQTEFRGRDGRPGMGWTPRDGMAARFSASDSPVKYTIRYTWYKGTLRSLNFGYTTLRVRASGRTASSQVRVAYEAQMQVRDVVANGFEMPSLGRASFKALASGKCQVEQRGKLAV